MTDARTRQLERLDPLSAATLRAKLRASRGTCETCGTGVGALPSLGVGRGWRYVDRSAGTQVDVRGTRCPDCVAGDPFAWRVRLVAVAGLESARETLDESWECRGTNTLRRNPCKKAPVGRSTWCLPCKCDELDLWLPALLASATEPRHREVAVLCAWAAGKAALSIHMCNHWESDNPCEPEGTCRSLPPDEAANECQMLVRPRLALAAARAWLDDPSERTLRAWTIAIDAIAAIDVVRWLPWPPGYGGLTNLERARNAARLAGEPAIRAAIRREIVGSYL